MLSEPAGAGAASFQMSPTVGYMTAARMKAGTIVQPSSSLVLPWIWEGIRSRPLRCRYLTMMKMMPPSTITNTATATQKTGTKRFFISRALGPAGLSVS